MLERWRLTLGILFLLLYSCTTGPSMRVQLCTTAGLDNNVVELSIPVKSDFLDGGWRYVGALRRETTCGIVDSPFSPSSFQSFEVPAYYWKLVNF
ncbi:hypothetical protein EV401DRAFT_982028 [Pisolithus croceorrhizus]|nr:hypothetical protein EV401DRAFT_982028 [Pisolithus croceorrhizus]